MGPRCIKGCPPGQKLHHFPLNETRRAEWLRLLGAKSSGKYLFACSRHFSKENLFRGRTFKFSVPNNESYELNADKIVTSDLVSPQVPNLNKKGHICLDDISMNSEKESNHLGNNSIVNDFIDDSSNLNSPKKRIKVLKASLDYYRTKYIEETRSKSKLRAENVRLTSELAKCKHRINKLELELKKKNCKSPK